MARLHPLAVMGLVRELGAAVADVPPLAVDGARGLADVLARELGRGGAPGFVRRGGAEGAAALVYVLAADPTADDRLALKAARRARTPIVVVVAGPEVASAPLPYVLATDVVRVPAGSGFPLDDIARVLAGRLGEPATQLAARLPALRRGVSDELVRSFSRRAGLIGAAFFARGADFPVLTLLQLRLALRIGTAHGHQVDQERVPEILGVIAGGLAFRTVARQALAAIPVAGWAVKGGVAYAGTRAVGEAAVRYFEARSAAAPSRA
jgi:uncharacterized protein (DUF697 family)